METYEQWTRSEIARLRAQAETATVEADALQRTLDRWLQLQGGAQQNLEQTTSEKHGSNGARPPVRPRKNVHGNKNAFALEKIKEASPDGLTTDQLYDLFVEVYGPKYKRSSIRSLLWNQRKNGKIEDRGGRHVSIEAPAAA